MKRARVGALALGLASLLTTNAIAAEALPELVFVGCEGLLGEDAVRARLRIERPVGASFTRRAQRLSVTCSGSIATLSVGDLPPLTKTLELHDAAPDVRARVAAIAIVELLDAASSEPSSSPPAPIAVAHRRPQRGASLRVEGVASAQVFFVERRALLGAGVRVAGDPSRHFGWVVDLLEHHGTADATLGRVRIDDVTVGLAAVAHHDASRVGVVGGLGFRIGATLLRGEPTHPDAVHGGRVAWIAGGPVATVAVRVRPASRLVLELAAEAGYWTFPTGALVDGRRALAVEGPWLGVQLGVGIIL